MIFHWEITVICALCLNSNINFRAAGAPGSFLWLPARQLRHTAGHSGGAKNLLSLFVFLYSPPI